MGCRWRSLCQRLPAGLVCTDSHPPNSASMKHPPGPRLAPSRGTVTPSNGSASASEVLAGGVAVSVFVDARTGRVTTNQTVGNHNVKTSLLAQNSRWASLCLFCTRSAQTLSRSRGRCPGPPAGLRTALGASPPPSRGVHRCGLPTWFPDRCCPRTRPLRCSLFNSSFQPCLKVLFSHSVQKTEAKSLSSFICFQRRSDYL